MLYCWVVPSQTLCCETRKPPCRSSPATVGLPAPLQACEARLLELLPSNEGSRAEWLELADEYDLHRLKEAGQ